MDLQSFERALTRHDLPPMPDDRHRYELVEGQVVVTPVPSLDQRRVIAALFGLLHRACPDHLCLLPGPFDVVLSRRTLLQPDLLVIEADQLDDHGLRGAPLLVIEVLSAAAGRPNKSVRKRLYRQAGVAAYWLLDVEGDFVTLVAWELRDGQYEVVAAIAGDEEWTATVPFDVTVVPSRLVR